MHAAIIYAIALHVMWGIVLLIQGTPSLITNLDELSHMVNGNVRAIGFVLIGVATLSIYAMVDYSHNGRRARGLLLLLPQQFVLTLSMFSSMHAVYSGHFADGIPSLPTFILLDQMPSILAAVIHTFAIFYYYSNRVHDSLNRLWPD